MVHIQENVDLKNHSTMRLGGRARYLAKAANVAEIAELLAWARSHDLVFLMIGQGSNIIWRDQGFDGLIIVNKILGREILQHDDQGATIKVGAGEIWDDVVAWTVEQGWSGIEFLSKIPGITGAAPVQNIGAYGAELSDVLIKLEAYDTKEDKQIEISKDDCAFSYRNSRFKSTDKGRFMITGVTLKLSTGSPQPPFYESLAKYFEQHPVAQYSPAIIRQAVTAIRSEKLPDPKKIANNGSFFTNPFVGQERFEELQKQYPDIKGWPGKDGQVKLSAGWLVEKAGLRGVHDQQTGMATLQASALVLINEHAHSTQDLLTFKQKIIDKVQEMFGLTLDQEPELLP